MDYKAMSIEELEAEIGKIKAEIESRKPANIFTVNFEATNDPRKGTPYVARLTWADGKLQRSFINLNKSWGKKEVTISGEYETTPGEIIEERTGGSWKNDYRYWYLTMPDGKQMRVDDISDSKKKALVQKYLQGKAKVEELV